MKAYSITMKHTCFDISQNWIQEMVLFLIHTEILSYTFTFLYYRLPVLQTVCCVS